jgi:hypothetical protein
MKRMTYWVQLRRLLTGKALVHCWTDNPEDAAVTCLRAWGHWGAHEWTADDEIRFVVTG